MSGKLRPITTGDSPCSRAPAQSEAWSYVNIKRDERDLTTIINATEWGRASNIIVMFTPDMMSPWPDDCCSEFPRQYLGVCVIKCGQKPFLVLRHYDTMSYCTWCTRSAQSPPIICKAPTANRQRRWEVIRHADRQPPWTASLPVAKKRSYLINCTLSITHEVVYPKKNTRLIIHTNLVHLQMI